MNNQEFGQYGEDLACRYLENDGYEIIERRFRTENGEMDIVARTEDCLVFIEVKTRSSYDTGHGIDTLTPQKMNRLKRLINDWFFYRKASSTLDLRLDLISILVQQGEKPYLEHFCEVSV